MHGRRHPVQRVLSNGPDCVRSERRRRCQAGEGTSSIADPCGHFLVASPAINAINAFDAIHDGSHGVSAYLFRRRRRQEKAAPVKSLDREMRGC